MHILYNSSQYTVAEFPGHGGIELMDKQACRSAFLQGEIELVFRDSIADLAIDDSSDEQVDEFLGLFDALMTQRVRLH